MIGITDSMPNTGARPSPAHDWVVNANRPVRYRVVESTALFSPENETLLEHLNSAKRARRRALVVIDENVHRIYGKLIQDYFEYHGVEARLFSVPTGEARKDIDNALRICRALHDCGLNRRSEPLIGVGGGVLLDIVGLAATLYRRGIPYIRVPTTLIGLIDAGIGVKTGVNFDCHKNRLGSYYAPIAAYLDRGFLRTLDERHLSNGLAEILKIALIKDARLFELMERHAQGIVTSQLRGTQDHDEIFRRAIQGMLEDLEPNLWEDVLERRVDYGHSFSPDLEMKAGPTLLHGEAVGIDMVLSLLLARGRGLLDEGELERVLTVMHHLRLPVFHPLVTTELMWSALGDTIKHRDGLQRLPLTVGLGDCTFVNDVTPGELARAVQAHRELGARFDDLSAA